MANLTEQFFRKILAAEGGYQNQSADHGNYNRCGANAGTKYGITPNAWQEYSGMKCPGAGIMENLSVNDARAFMDWWGHRWRIWEIFDLDVAELVFNAFYGNPTAAAKTLQQILNQRGYSLTVDGIVGSRTLAAVNVEVSKDKSGLYNAYRSAWLSYLVSIGSLDYTAGWTNRMNTYFLPLPAQPAVSKSKNYQAELWQRRVSGMFRSAEDAIWVLTAICLALSVCAIVYFNLKPDTK